jgi:hypothetical protein
MYTSAASPGLARAYDGNTSTVIIMTIAIHHNIENWLSGWRCCIIRAGLPNGELRRYD